MLLEDRLLDGLGRVLALQLVLHLRGGVERGSWEARDGLQDLRVHPERLEVFLLLADPLGQFALQRADLSDRRVGDVERVEYLRLGDLVAPPRP